MSGYLSFPFIFLPSAQIIFALVLVQSFSVAITIGVMILRFGSTEWSVVTALWLSSDAILTVIHFTILIQFCIIEKEKKKKKKYSAE